MDGCSKFEHYRDCFLLVKHFLQIFPKKRWMNLLESARIIHKLLYRDREDGCTTEVTIAECGSRNREPARRAGVRRTIADLRSLKSDEDKADAGS